MATKEWLDEARRDADNDCPFNAESARTLLDHIAALDAAVARIAPVVRAAEAWRPDPCKGLGSHSEHALDAAVRLYQESTSGTPVPAPASVQTVGIGPADTAIIVEALELWDRYLTAPHADIARIKAALTGTVLS